MDFLSLYAFGTSCNYGGELEDIKLILRPLSDLTKEIEVNGERFVPIDWLEKNIPPSKKHSNTVTFTNGYIEMCYYVEYQKLFEWHFDVFGLIPQGLAIDYNTTIEKIKAIKPTKEKFGWVDADGFESEGGWAYEGGEEAYIEALQKWEVDFGK